MDKFEFAFTLFGLVLGMSITAVLTGFVKAYKLRKQVAIDWQMILLGALVALDLISFWYGTWLDRDDITINYLTLLLGGGVAAIYYAAASLVFPDGDGEWTTDGNWFGEHKPVVAGGILLANLLMAAAELWMSGGGAGWDLRTWLTRAIYLGLAAALIFTRPGLWSRITMALMLLTFAELAWSTATEA